MWKNILETDGPQMTIRRMRIACCILKATDTPSEYVIIIAFLLQQWSHDRDSLLRYTYSTWRVLLITVTSFCAVSPSVDVGWWRRFDSGSKLNWQTWGCLWYQILHHAAGIASYLRLNSSLISKHCELPRSNRQNYTERKEAKQAKLLRHGWLLPKMKWNFVVRNHIQPFNIIFHPTAVTTQREVGGSSEMPRSAHRTDR